MVKTDNDLVRRGLKLGRLGFSLTGSYLAYQVQNLIKGSELADERRKAFHARASRRARSELGNLKGPAMKIGQVLSMMGHAFPKEAIKELAQLQGQAPAMHPTLARAQFKGSFGRPPEEMFAEFDDVPFAAASLGQVHRARAKDGELLAVKIQYPGIRSAIENDFKLIRSATLPVQVFGHVASDLIAEAEWGFLQETDYVNEARNLEAFRGALAPLTYLRIPHVRPELSTDRVLTMSLLSGKSVDEFLAARPKKKLRNLIGQRLMEIYHFELRATRAFHADPHPGNYLLNDDGTIGLVDFGCIKRCSKDLCALVDTLIDGGWKNQPGGFRRIARFVCGNDKLAASAGGQRLAKTGIARFEKLFPSATPGTAKVDFGNKDFLTGLTSMWDEALRERIANPEYVFASRAELGLTYLLHRLAARIDTALVRCRVGEQITGTLERLD
ncbi:MAG: putative protein kinase UbiB [Verrucomicrobia subdivision 3 bacterium]|nr:putative protein kinase UbiB [Limisphaerales bacterium]MCS1415238.1 putative protein kinase UbiB [Limisphaerales bacterium]